MRADVWHFSVGAGLDIAMCDQLPAGHLPMATIRIQSGAAELLSSGDGCTLAVTVSPIRLNSILGYQEAIDYIVGKTSGSGAVTISIRDAVMVRRISNEIRAATHEGAGRDLFLQSKVLELLAEGMAERPPVSGTSAVQLVRDVLIADPANPPDLAELSHLTGLAPRKLNEQFRAEFGMTIFDWLTDWKLTRARQLLLEGGMSIKDIARSLGYGHVSNFTTAFNRRFGETPARLRAQADDGGTGLNE